MIKKSINELAVSIYLGKTFENKREILCRVIINGSKGGVEAEGLGSYISLEDRSVTNKLLGTTRKNGAQHQCAKYKRYDSLHDKILLLGQIIRFCRLIRIVRKGRHDKSTRYYIIRVTDYQ